MPPTEEQGRVRSVDSFHRKSLSNCVSAHVYMGKGGVAVYHKQMGRQGCLMGKTKQPHFSVKVRNLLDFKLVVLNLCVSHEPSKPSGNIDT